MSKYTEQLEHCGCSCAKAGLNEIAHLRGLIARASEELRLLVFLGARTSSMTKSEMNDLLTLMEAFASERGVTFRDQVEALEPLLASLKAHADAHGCGCQEPCDDYWVYPNCCPGKYRTVFHELIALARAAQSNDPAHDIAGKESA